MKKRFKIPLFVIVILIIMIVGLIFLSLWKRGSKETIVKVLDSIDTYGYTLDERDTDYMKSIYKELKETLKAKEIDFESYGKSLTKLFVADLFTLDNKINKYDCGGVEYIYPSAKESFKRNVKDTLYKSLVDNSNNKRKQSLPIVKNVEIKEFKEDKFKLMEKEYDAYVVNVDIFYEVNMGYDNSATITLVKEDGKLYVASYEAGDAVE